MLTPGVFETLYSHMVSSIHGKTTSSSSRSSPLGANIFQRSFFTAPPQVTLTTNDFIHSMYAKIGSSIVLEQSFSPLNVFSVLEIIAHKGSWEIFLPSMYYCG